MFVLVTALIPAYIVSPPLFNLLMVEALGRVLRSGVHPSAGLLYTWTASVLHMHGHDRSAFGDVAMMIGSRFPDSPFRAFAICMYVGLLGYRTCTKREAERLFSLSLRLARECGDVACVSYVLVSVAFSRFYCAPSLSALLDDINAWRTLCAAQKLVSTDLQCRTIAAFANAAQTGRSTLDDVEPSLGPRVGHVVNQQLTGR